MFTVMAWLAFMEVQSAGFGSGAPPNLNMDTTFTQRQRETCRPVFSLGTDLRILGPVVSHQMTGGKRRSAGLL